MGAEAIKKKNRNKQSIEKWKKKEEKRRIQGKPNNNKHLWFYPLHQKSYFARKHSLKKVVYTITFYLQFLCVAAYLKCSSGTPKLNTHKYTTFNIIEIYINRLSTTTQIFIAMD